MEPALPPATLTAPTSPAWECNTTPVLNSEVFEEEVSDIAQVHFENDLFEFELTDNPPLVNVKGNLRRKLWKRIGTSKFILNVIERGYILPFLSLPEPAVFRNNRSSLAHAKFVEDAIRELVESGRVLEVVVPPLVVNPLSVSTGKKRLILDLRYVNKCLRKMRVKYEDWKIASSYFMTEAFMFSFDLKSGYHHIEIFEGHQTYLGFSWKHGSSNFTKFYVFTVLPFGLSSAPHIFTKTLKPLEKHWRHQGICIAIFLDDGWAIERDRQVCSSVSKAVKPILVRQVLSQMTRNRYGNLASESIGWVLHGTVLEEPLKSSIGDVPKYSVLLTVLLTLASLFLLEIWPLSRGKLFLHHQFPGTSLES